MDLFRKMTIKSKLYLVLMLVMFSYFFMAGIVLYNLNSVEREFQQLKNKEVQGQILTLLINLDKNYESKLTRDIMLGADYDKSIKKLEKRIKRIKSNFNKLMGTALSEDELELIKKAKKLTEKALSTEYSIVKPLKDVPPEERYKTYTIYHEKASPIGEEARKYFQKVAEIKAQHFERGFKDVQKEIDFIKKIIYIGAPISLLVIAFILIGIIITISKPIDKFVKSFSKAVEGDLTTRMTEKGNDEISILSIYFNNLMESINKVFEKAKNNIKLLFNTTGDLKQDGEKTLKLASEQENSLNLILENISKLNSSAERIDITVNETLKNATQDTLQKTKEGKESIEDTIKKINQIKEKAEMLASNIEELSISSEEIGKITNVINELANQTNLLALNAAIEAARAGEFGRGFAVVADEVRNLAERTRKATEEINQIIEKLQNDAQNAKKEMESAKESVEEGVETAQKTEIVFDEIVNKINIVTEVGDKIRSEVKTENKLLKEISDKTHSFSEIMKQSCEDTREVVEKIKQLESSTEELVKMLDQFKT
ncbi:methyl-accepting chemotaxis protein [Hydrogenivirga sp. 128-5-R1-1]|uniref:methyl-accepting chemotaxis protein n=1 Tax=Hydrogenivirga sp. 128-5-R1-1 TaxID=392423 RepID=UPI00015F0955|nr:methyl-accepting chemotaxis protein [Hydrogenivirga sp. 128-5-R1-1]EDP74274.1 methyl-accepting chemotaxis sensory transducer [Hydrogenivirga sp. 128-5-R1-1]